MSPQEKAEQLSEECRFKATTSGGKGGQNVNKVATKVELYFDINSSEFLTQTEKELLKRKLFSKLNDEGILRVTSSEHRTQLKNKQQALKKFSLLIAHALTKRKKRKQTKPTDTSVEERLKNKRALSDKKKLRNKPD